MRTLLTVSGSKDGTGRLRGRCGKSHSRTVERGISVTREIWQGFSPAVSEPLNVVVAPAPASLHAAGGTRTHTLRRAAAFETARLPVPAPPRASHCRGAARAVPVSDGTRSQYRPPRFRLAVRVSTQTSEETLPRAAALVPPGADPAALVRLRRPARGLADRQPRQGPVALVRPVPRRADAGDGLRADRARLLARLRDPRADQLRPRRRLHARRDDDRHRSSAVRPADARQRARLDLADAADRLGLHRR